MKISLSIIFSFFILAIYAQVPDSMSFKIREEIMRLISVQDVFEYQNKGLPSFELKQVDGKKFNSQSLNGKPTVLNFWFTACAPCIEEIPMFNALMKSYSKKVNFVAITYENREDIAQFLERKSFEFLHLVEGNDYFKQLDVKSCPRTLITDKNLIVRFIDKNKPKDLTLFEKELRRQIDEILKR